MFVRQPLFDALLRPAIENPSVTSTSFVLDERQRASWDRDVWPKVVECNGFQKVTEPKWSSLKEGISFILGQARSGASHGMPA